eukprot:5579525-Alexandrium_andersonii.AAC.1
MDDHGEGDAEWSRVLASVEEDTAGGGVPCHRVTWAGLPFGFNSLTVTRCSCIRRLKLRSSRGAPQAIVGSAALL